MCLSRSPFTSCYNSHIDTLRDAHMTRERDAEKGWEWCCPYVWMPLLSYDTYVMMRFWDWEMNTTKMYPIKATHSSNEFQKSDIFYFHLPLSFFITLIQSLFTSIHLSMYSHIRHNMNVVVCRYRKKLPATVCVWNLQAIAVGVWVCVYVREHQFM